MYARPLAERICSAGMKIKWKAVLMICVIYTISLLIFQNRIMELCQPEYTEARTKIPIEHFSKIGIVEDSKSNLYKMINETWFILNKLQSNFRQRNLTKLNLKANKTRRVKIQHMVETPIINITHEIKPKVQEEMDQYYRKRDEIVNPYTHGYIINNDKICDESTEMLIIVHSFHPYIDRRMAIRLTWGGSTNNGVWPHRSIGGNIKLVFMFGLHRVHIKNEYLYNESNVHQDIIQGDFIDDYKNMTLKSLLGLKYVSEHCKSAKYLLKTDDDMFINLPYLMQILHSQPFKRSIMGPYNGKSRVYRGGKWKMTPEQFPFKYYPPYEAGAAYIISADITSELFQTAEYVPWIFIDDVYITGILGKIVNVTHVKHDGFAFWTSKAPQPCDFVQDKFITGTNMNPLTMMKTWAEIQHGKCKVGMLQA